MYKDILLAFSTFQLVFLLLDIYILSKTGRDIARKGEYTSFCMLIIIHMFYLLTNTLWTLQEYALLHIPSAVLMVVCTISLWSVATCAVAFFLFVVEKLQIKVFLEGSLRWIWLLPAIVFSLLVFSNPWTKLVFTLSEEGHFIHERYYLTSLAIASAYLLFIAGVAGVNMFKAHTTFKRQSNGAVFGSVVILFLFILMDGSMTKASILPAAIFAVIVIIFITMQDSNINSDALTGMNNRRKADEYLSNRLEDVSPANPLYLYMGDLDGFKKINDNYGHAVGDEALILCSQALKRTIGKYNGFAARFGGDEFMLACSPVRGKEFDPDNLVWDVADCLKELAEGKPYPLKMTIGYTMCTDPKKSLNTYIKLADEMLYQRKSLKGVGR